MGWPHWRAVGCWVPSSAPPRPPGASSRRCGRRALAAHPLVVAVPSGSGPWGAEPADVSPGFPTPGASPSPGPPPPPQRGLLSGGSGVTASGTRRGEGTGVGAAQETGSLFGICRWGNLGTGRWPAPLGAQGSIIAYLCAGASGWIGFGVCVAPVQEEQSRFRPR